MKWLFMRPFDTLFFRDGRPFEAGDAHFAQSLFPPSPSVAYGALRTAILVGAKVDLLEFKAGNAKGVPETAGATDRLGTLSIAGPIPGRRQPGVVELLIQPPLNLVSGEESSKDDRLQFLTPNISPYRVHTDLSLSLDLCMAQEKVVSADKYYLSFDQALALCAGIVPQLSQLSRQEDFWRFDNRVGIARTGKRTAEEGMLYSSCHVQIDNHPRNRDQVSGLVVKVLNGGDDLCSPGIIQLGGEKRFCEFKEIDILQPTRTQISQIVNKIDEKKRFFLWLISPAIFSDKKHAFIPDFINPDTASGKFDGKNVKLVGCQIGRAVSIGGWDIAKNAPKPMRRAVPAGSIYFFQLNEARAGTTELVKKWMLRPLPGQMPDYDKQGFGTVLIGGY